MCSLGPAPPGPSALSRKSQRAGDVAATQFAKKVAKAAAKKMARKHRRASASLLRHVEVRSLLQMLYIMLIHVHKLNVFLCKTEMTFQPVVYAL